MDPSKYPDYWYRGKVTAFGIKGDDIEDAMQEAKLAVWLGKNVRSRLIDWIRTKTRFNRKERVPTEPLEIADTAFLGWTDDDEDEEADSWLGLSVGNGEDALCALEDVRQALGSDAVTPKQRRAFILFYQEDMRTMDIAKALDTSGHNVWQLVGLARRKVIAALDRDMVA